MRRVAITGLGFITSIGNDTPTVITNLKNSKTGIELFEEFKDSSIPVKLAGTIKNFEFPSVYFEDWKIPAPYSLTRDQLRPMTPNAVYAYCAMKQAIESARLSDEEISNPRAGLLTASGGSMWMAYDNVHTMITRGVQRCQPMAIINSIPGALYINIGALFKIQGGTLGFSSACSSSAHALGIAYDQITTGRQTRVFVVGAEDCNKFSILPFASVRALSVQKDPKNAPRAFDKKRDGFVGTGGAAAIVLEDLETALQRGSKIYAEVAGWGQSSDGYNVLAPEPNGAGLARSMKLALENAKINPTAIDYINAHATSTLVGDVAEIRAIKSVFPEGKRPYLSSTKSLTGHALSAAGALEAGISCLTLDEGFIPISANITELDPECDGVPIVTQPMDIAPKTIMSNSSGFGGTNVSLILRKWQA